MRTTTSSTGESKPIKINFVKFVLYAMDSIHVETKIENFKASIVASVLNVLLVLTNNHRAFKRRQIPFFS